LSRLIDVGARIRRSSASRLEAIHAMRRAFAVARAVFVDGPSGAHRFVIGRKRATHLAMRDTSRGDQGGFAHALVRGFRFVQKERCWSKGLANAAQKISHRWR